MHAETDFTRYVPDTWTRVGLESAGYTGFVPFERLRDDPPPTCAGVYAVLRESTEPPQFLELSAAGKTRDVTAPPETLHQEWVPGAQVLYIGRATSGKRRNGLHRRLQQYRRTGAGTADHHSGGVWVFQLNDAASLLLCWRTAHDPLTCSSAP